MTQKVRKPSPKSKQTWIKDLEAFEKSVDNYNSLTKAAENVSNVWDVGALDMEEVIVLLNSLKPRRSSNSLLLVQLS
jgi:hypothetical protein